MFKTIKNMRQKIKRTTIKLKTIAYLLALFVFIVPGNSSAISLEPNYSYGGNEIPDVCFFPVDNARWNGYEVLNSDWKSLDNYQKIKFITEATNEIEVVEGVRVVISKDPEEVINDLEKWIDFSTRIKDTQMLITMLLKYYYENGKISGDLILDSSNHPYLVKKISATILAGSKEIDVKVGKTYIGYLTCYKKDGEWMTDSEKPKKEEIKNNTLFFSKRAVVPFGSTVLTENYPLNFNYKIKDFRELNSFVDAYGIKNYYYKVILEVTGNTDNK